MTRRRAVVALAIASMALIAACASSAGARRAIPSASPTSDVLSTSPPPGCPAGSTVYDAEALVKALASATPGAVIVIAPGHYEGQFAATASGTDGSPITMCGSKDAVLDGGSTKSGYTLHLDGASWWRLIGFSIEGGQKGLMTDHASHVVIQGLNVHDTGDEGIHLRSFSSDDTIDGVTVSNTGLLTPKFGEGIYIGTANSNWCKYSGCQPDRSDRDVIQNSEISDTTAENIDIKEGTTGGKILNNRLSGQGMNAGAATAWVNVKGNGWTISGNTGRTSVKDGFQVHRVYAGWGQGNLFSSNHAEVDGPGYGFYVQSAALATVLACSNTASGAAAGLSNMACSP